MRSRCASYGFWLLNCDVCADALKNVLDSEREMPEHAIDLAEVGMPFHYNAIAHKLLELCVYDPLRGFVRAADTA